MVGSALHYWRLHSTLRKYNEWSGARPKSSTAVKPVQILRFQPRHWSSFESSAAFCFCSIRSRRSPYLLLRVTCPRHDIFLVFIIFRMTPSGFHSSRHHTVCYAMLGIRSIQRDSHTSDASCLLRVDICRRLYSAQKDRQYVTFKYMVDDS